MKRIETVLTLMLVQFLCTISVFAQEERLSDVYEDLEAGWKNMDQILERIKAPVFPDQQFVITDYGAENNGKICTEAFRKAILACHEAGGGRVLVPEGTYLTGAIHLLSNVELHVTAGATILFSTNPKDYLPVVQTRYEGSELYNYSPLIYAYKQENIALTGNGILDGQASDENWWAWNRNNKKKTALRLPSQNDSASIPRLLELMAAGVPTIERVFGEGSYLRPSFVQPYLCKNILIEGVTIKNPPMWMLHPVLSENISIRGVKLFSQGAPNGDGCDPEACKDILIEGCQFNNGDDCIAIRINQNYHSKAAPGPVRYTTYRNIFVENMSCEKADFAIQIIGLAEHPVENVQILNCTFNHIKEENVLENVNRLLLYNVSINNDVLNLLQP